MKSSAGLSAGIVGAVGCTCGGVDAASEGVVEVSVPELEDSPVVVGEVGVALSLPCSCSNMRFISSACVRNSLVDCRSAMTSTFCASAVSVRTAAKPWSTKSRLRLKVCTCPLMRSIRQVGGLEWASCVADGDCCVPGIWNRVLIFSISSCALCNIALMRGSSRSITIASEDVAEPVGRGGCPNPSGCGKSCGNGC